MNHAAEDFFKEKFDNNALGQNLAISTKINFLIE
jgi:hypothetical protein